MFEGKDGDYRVMVKVATAVMIFAIAVTAILLILGWVALIILGVAFIWIGVTTISTNWALATVEILVGTGGLACATIIFLLYSERYHGRL